MDKLLPIVNVVANFFKGLINGIIDVINAPIKWINSKLGLKIKTIPRLAVGATITKPTLAVLGERGPENVTPASGSVRAGSRFESSSNITVNIGNVWDQRMITELDQRLFAISRRKNSFRR